MYQEGEISICICSKCHGEFPVYTFVGDTDMVTSGCVALSGENNSIILTMRNSNESVEAIESRVGLNHKIVEVSYKNNNVGKIGTFQEFQKTYKPATQLYKCIKCGNMAKVVKHETKKQFTSYGNIAVV
ncbi:hypothetical protein ITG08_13215 [Vibrio cyclitrophicus]|uniref:hypothetical protein n=1 Tax=Vibrio cyclitrophicus TaxID=47951 RepID=UPI0020563343|nr:hypothetical protein [Vibrio cyclitrophicus]UPR24859.1 hypothetical protein ITG08_13215 [Vibrio cyclitrophicus]